MRWRRILKRRWICWRWDHRLYELGYRGGAACNGVLDEITVNASKNFQQVNGLTPTGVPDSVTVELLLSERAVSEGEYLQNEVTQRQHAGVLAEGAYGDAVLKLQRARSRNAAISAIAATARMALRRRPL